MRSPVYAVLALALALPSAGAAQAQTASASFNITVIIPPLAEAIALRDLGAAGDWTILKPGGGFMIAMPKGETTDDQTMTVFRSDRQRFVLDMMDEGSSRSLAPTLINPTGQLTAMAYQLPESALNVQRARLVFSSL